MSHWIYDNKVVTDVPDGIVGFVYLITNTETDKKYIGRKYFHSTRRVKQKGRVRKKVVKKESNWKEYTSSSEELNEAIEQFGKEKFTFEILQYGKTKGEVNYLEEYYQFMYNVVLREDFYNKCIGANKFMGLSKSKNKSNLLESIKKRL